MSIKHVKALWPALGYGARTGQAPLTRAIAPVAKPHINPPCGGFVLEQVALFESAQEAVLNWNEWRISSEYAPYARGYPEFCVNGGSL